MSKERNANKPQEEDGETHLSLGKVVSRKRKRLMENGKFYFLGGKRERRKVMDMARIVESGWGTRQWLCLKIDDSKLNGT